MSFTYLLALVLALTTLTACSPTLNWREVQVDQTPMLALFPCKPELNSREVTLGGKAVTMTLMGCEAGGASFALVNADLKDATTLDAIQTQWRQATLANIHAQKVKESLFSIQTGRDKALALRVIAQGLRPDGSTMHLQGVWFALGTHVFLASVVSDQASPATAESFFEGLRAP